MCGTTYLSDQSDVCDRNNVRGKLEEAAGHVEKLRLMRGGLLPSGMILLGPHSASTESRASTGNVATMAEKLQAQVLDDLNAVCTEMGIDNFGMSGDKGSGMTSMQERQELKGYVNWLYGEALISIDTNTPSVEAEKYLTCSVKLDPSLVEAWNALSECFYRKGELDLSQHCIRRGLEVRRNVHGLRMLSMLSRKRPRTEAITVEDTKESIALAKEALSMDINDCNSWAFLGNCYLAHYVANDSARLDILKLSQKAYANAASKDEGKHRPDLHFNRATSYILAAEFEDALKSYDQVTALDDKWLCHIEKEAIYDTLKALHGAVHAQGGLKQKRKQTLSSYLKHKAEAFGSNGALTNLDGGRNSSNSLWCVIVSEVIESSSQSKQNGVSNWKLAVSHDEIFFVIKCYGSRATGMLVPGASATVTGVVLSRVFTDQENEVYDFPMVLVDSESSIKVVNE